MQDCIFVGQLFFVGGFFQSSWGFFTVPKQRMGLLEETFFSFSPFGAHCPCMRLHRHSQHGLLHLLSFFPIPLHPFPTLLWSIGIYLGKILVHAVWRPTSLIVRKPKGTNMCLTRTKGGPQLRLPDSWASQNQISTWKSKTPTVSSHHHMYQLVLKDGLIEGSTLKTYWQDQVGPRIQVNEVGDGEPYSFSNHWFLMTSLNTSLGSHICFMKSGGR